MSHEEAVINQYKEILRRGGIKPGMTVLDAGCGVGGGAIYIAKRTGAVVTGISITRSQITEANGYARQAGVASRTQFIWADYMKTPFPAESFDVIYAIESVCHAYPKVKFLREMRRILKRGGRLIIADGYLKRGVRDDREGRILERFCRGWRLKELATTEEMGKAVVKANLTIKKTEEVTEWIRPNSKRMIILVILSTPVLLLARVFGSQWAHLVAENVGAIVAVLMGVRRGMGGYYIHELVKN